MPPFVPDHSGYLEALMLLSTLSGGLSMMHVSSLMISCTHWLWTSLVSMVFPVYIMSIAYWRAQASSADHWHHLSRWCSQVSWYSRALLVLCSSVGRLYVSMLIGSSAFSVLYRVIVYNGYCNGMCACEHIAYRRLAESSWEASGGLL